MKKLNVGIVSAIFFSECMNYPRIAGDVTQVGAAGWDRRWSASAFFAQAELDRRLLEPIGDIPPAEYEALYYQNRDQAMAAWLKPKTLRRNRGDSVRHPSVLLVKNSISIL